MNDRLVTEIKRAMAELADATPPTPPLDELLIRRHEPRRPWRPRLFTITAVSVSLAAAIVGLVLISDRDDRDNPTSPPTTTPRPVDATTVTTGAPPATTTATTPATTSSPQTSVVPTTTTAAPPAVVGPPDSALATGFEPASITWISLQQGWLLGHAPCSSGTCLSLARTRDGGQTWHGVPAPVTTASRVRFADAKNGWIFGDDLYATHDGGVTWTKVDGLSNVSDLEASKGRVWAEAAWPQFPDSQIVYSSVTTADDWHQIGDMTVSTPISMRGGTGYVRGPDGGLFVVTASGFDVRTDPCGNESDIGSIAAVDDQTVAVVCGFDSAAGSESKRFNISHDGGHTFTVVGEAPRSGIASSAAAASATTFVIAATSGASFLYRSTDGGATWNTVFQDNGGGAPLADLGFTDATHGVAVLGTRPSVLLTTSDAGATWVKAAIHD